MHVPLDGPVDLERVIRDVPPEYTMKGMFFERQRAALGAGFATMKASLSRPPARAYAAFEPYPTSDYCRLIAKVAEERFGKASTREGIRLLGRGEVEVFAATTLGRVTFAMLREPGAALLRYPDVTGVLVQGPKIRARRTGERGVHVYYTRYRGIAEYVVGVLEGLVSAFDEEPVITVKLEPGGAYTLDVAW